MLNLLNLVLGNTTVLNQRLIGNTDITTLNGAMPEIDPNEIIADYVAVSIPAPYLLMGAGMALSLLFGLNFARLIESKLNEWKVDKKPLLPLRSLSSTISYAGLVVGISFLIAGSMEVFNFALGPSVLIGSIVSLLTGIAFWIQIQRVMRQIETNNFMSVDFDNFDEFF